ncbi:MAG: DUF952 domain-containing protein [Chitinophagaceae bacterium]|nr:DUF952 domain-containing protein [Chitinophagaceae bacterium]
MPVIYHIAFANAWAEAKQKGSYEHPTLKSEGFIHCSLDNQVAGVLERYFQGEKNLVKLVIDTDKLTSKFIFDWSQSTADTYPHIYGPINIDAVIDVLPIN